MRAPKGQRRRVLRRATSRTTREACVAPRATARGRFRSTCSSCPTWTSPVPIAAVLAIAPRPRVFAAPRRARPVARRSACLSCSRSRSMRRCHMLPTSRRRTRSCEPGKHHRPLPGALADFLPISTFFSIARNTYPYVRISQIGPYRMPRKTQEGPDSFLNCRGLPIALSARLRAYPSLFAIAWSMSLLSVFCCSGDVIAPTIGSPTMLPFLSTT